MNHLFIELDTIDFLSEKINGTVIIPVSKINRIESFLTKKDLVWLYISSRDKEIIVNINNLKSKLKSCGVIIK